MLSNLHRLSPVGDVKKSSSFYPADTCRKTHQSSQCEWASTAVFSSWFTKSNQDRRGIKWITAFWKYWFEIIKAARRHTESSLEWRKMCTDHHLLAPQTTTPQSDKITNQLDQDVFQRIKTGFKSFKLEYDAPWSEPEE